MVHVSWTMVDINNKAGAPKPESGHEGDEAGVGLNGVRVGVDMDGMRVCVAVDSSDVVVVRCPTKRICRLRRTWCADRGRRR